MVMEPITKQGVFGSEAEDLRIAGTAVASTDAYQNVLHRVGHESMKLVEMRSPGGGRSTFPLIFT